MDRSQSAYAPSIDLIIQYQQNQYYNTPPPWRNPANKMQASNFNRQDRRGQHTKGDYYGDFAHASVDIYALVDSWRSYKDDTANLQTAATSSSNLDATAPSFQPTQNASYYKPYEPLRVSDGSKERNLVKQAKKASKHEKKLETVPGVASRHPVRTNRGQADQPVPSIEGVNLDDWLGSNSLNQALECLHNGKYRRVDSRAKTPRQTASPAPPSLTEKYRSQAHKEPVKVAEARKLLVILDLNGTLLYRIKTGTKKVHMRPGVTPLLNYLFSNHVVMVYTSTMPETARDMVSQFLHPTQRNKLAAIWARDKLDLNAEQYRSKVQVYKKLEKVWSDEDIQATAGADNRWDRSNTVLIDDSKLKALAQPHNLLQVLEYTKDDDPAKCKDKASQKQRHKIQVDILKQLELKLEELKLQEDVSRLIRKWQTGDVPVPRLAGQVVSVEENVDQKRGQQKETEESEHESTSRSRLPTPVSLTDGDIAERLMEISEDEEGGIILSKAPAAKQALKSINSTHIPGLDMISEEAEGGESRDRQSSESSVDEAVFKQLLGGDQR